VSAAATPGAFPVTVFESGRALAKHWGLRGGALQGTAAAYLSEGTAERRECASLSDLARRFTELSARHAVTFGTFEHERCAVRSERASGDYTGSLPLVQRTSACMRWRDGPGVMLLDYDPLPDATPLDPEALVRAVRAAEPALENVSLLWRASSSSYLYAKDGGAELRGLRGQHLYLVVSDARRIKEVGETLLARLWLAGHGFMRLSANGSLLLRSIVDASVWTPERLVFVRADCGEGVEQRMPEPRVFHGAAGGADAWLDPTTVGVLTAEDRAQVERLQHEAKNALQPAAHSARVAWIDARAAGLDDAAREAFRAAVDGGALPRALTVQLHDGRTLTVGDILENRAAFHGKRCADPVEPDYRGDGRIAVILTQGAGEPRIYSHAHGGIDYPLQTEEERSAAIAAEFDVVMLTPEQVAEGLLMRLQRSGSVVDVVAHLRTLSREDVLAAWVGLTADMPRAGVANVVEEVHRLTGVGVRALHAAHGEHQAERQTEQHRAQVARTVGQRARIAFRPADQTAMAREVDGAIVAKAKAGEYVEFAGVASRVAVQALPYAHLIDDPDGAAPPVPTIERLGPVGLLALAERAAVVVNESGKHPTVMAMPSDIVRILEHTHERVAPKVSGVVSHALVLPANGAIVAADGLDSRTGLFFSGAALPDTRPYVQAEAVDALARLRDVVLDGFEFAQPLDADAALAGLFTGVQRRVLDSAPGLAILASAQASGKTTLARRLHVLLTGHDMAVSSFPEGSEGETEMGKRLLAMLLRSPEMVCLDNITDGMTFRSAALARALTSPTYSDRVLGETRQAQAPTNALFVVTGNNLQLGADEVTRWAVCRLAPAQANPEQRKYKNPDVVAHALRARAGVLRDVVGIVAGYLVQPGSIDAASRFPAWDRCVRQPLMWAGGQDVARVFTANAALSDSHQGTEALLHTLRAAFADAEFTSPDVVAKQDEFAEGMTGGALRSALIALNAKDPRSERSVGRVLAAQLDRRAPAGVLRGRRWNGANLYRIEA
jgi:hypothetical protein